MNKELRMYRIVNAAMLYGKYEANTELPYETVKQLATDYCQKFPQSYFKTHVGDDHIARQIASELSGRRIW